MPSIVRCIIHKSSIRIGPTGQRCDDAISVVRARENHQPAKSLFIFCAHLRTLSDMLHPWDPRGNVRKCRQLWPFCLRLYIFIALVTLCTVIHLLLGAASSSQVPAADNKQEIDEALVSDENENPQHIGDDLPVPNNELGHLLKHHRSQKDNSNESIFDQLLFIVTLDGSIHALNPHTGVSIWRIHLSQGPLIASNYSFNYGKGLVSRSSIAYDQVNKDETDEIFLVEPLGPGYLYYMNKNDGLFFQRYPWTMKDLSTHEKPIRLPDGRYLVGSKKSEAIAIFRHSGKLLEQDVEEGFLSNDQQDDLIWFGRSDYTVSFYDATRKGSGIAWDISYSEITPTMGFTSEMPPFDFYASVPPIAEGHQKAKDLYHIASDIMLQSDFDSVVFAKNTSNNELLWTRTFTAPPVRYYQLSQDKSHVLPTTSKKSTATIVQDGYLPRDCSIAMQPIVPVFGLPSLVVPEETPPPIEFDHIVRLAHCEVLGGEDEQQQRRQRHLYYVLPELSFMYNIPRLKTKASPHLTSSCLISPTSVAIQSDICSDANHYQQLVPWWPHPFLTPPIYIQRSQLFFPSAKDSFDSFGRQALQPVPERLIDKRVNIDGSHILSAKYLVGARLVFKSNDELQRQTAKQYLLLGDLYQFQRLSIEATPRLSLPPGGGSKGRQTESDYYSPSPHHRPSPLEEAAQQQQPIELTTTFSSTTWIIAGLALFILIIIFTDWSYYRIRRYRRKRLRIKKAQSGSPYEYTGLWRYFKFPNRWGLYRHDTSEEEEDNFLDGGTELSPDGFLSASGSKESSKSSAIAPSPIASKLEDAIANNESLLASSPLSISSEILGYGSHGTVVYKGFFDPTGGASSSKKTVAIKRMLIEFYSVAEHEINLLHHSDHHPNIIRYYYHEMRPPFMYVALEWCPASLQDLFELDDDDDEPDADLTTEQDEVPRQKKETIANIKKSLPPMRKLILGLMQGLEHLHSMKIIHRDIKPANVLISPRLDKLLLSDFGLGKKITDQTSTASGLAYQHHRRGGGGGPGVGGGGGGLKRGGTVFIPTVCGTAGWRAPEILLWEAMGTWMKDSSSISSLSIPTTTTTTTTTAAAATAIEAETKPPPGFSDVKPSTSIEETIVANATSTPKPPSTRLPFKLQCSMDVFSAGCLIFYTLTGGYHPFGSGPHIESNILKGHYDLGVLSQRIQVASDEEESFNVAVSLDETDQCIPEAVDLVTRMICKEPSARPTMKQVLAHPYFWTAERRLSFLQDVSDRLSLIPDYDTGDELDENQHFIKSSQSLSRALQAAWRASLHSPPNWLHLLDTTLRSHLMNDQRRKYHGSKVADLIRALRNKRHHYQDLPLNIRQQFGRIPDGFLSYWTRRFPCLVLVCWQAVFMSGLLDDPNETVFRSYYHFEGSET